jgi:hypothetical protein
MAANPTPRASARRRCRGLPSLTERQLEAYLSCRDTLRRLRDASRLERPTPHARPASHP